MKHILVLAFLCVYAFSNLHAQVTADSTLEVVPLRETVISANRSSQARTSVTQQVLTLNQAQIAQVNAQNTADLLQSTGAVFVQKSQQGGGSPTLRGFEASRILLVVDGVRMNNAIYRAGHLQNVISLDNAALDRAEVLFGPASTMYGSDALGGAICLYTKDPVFAPDDKNFQPSGNAFVRYSTVNREKTGHFDFSLGGNRLAALTSFTYSDFDDLRMGKNNGFGAFYGKRNHYVERINGKDSLVRNADPYLQKFSGYSQYDILEKIVFRQNSNVSHTLNAQYSTSSNIPRYDRLTDPGSNGSDLNFAEWYYGPQERLMVAYQLRIKEAGWFNDGIKTTASWQGVEESRSSRRFGRTKRTDRIENISVYGLIVDARRKWGLQSLQLGIDMQYNDLTSTAQDVNVNDGSVSPNSTRYPDGDNTMLNAALYASHQWQASASSNWTFSEGLRVGISNLHSTLVDQSFFPLPYSAIDQKTPTYSGQLGALWNGEATRFAINASSGFRVPNVDDLAKIFESAQGSVIVPNADLKPEKTLNLEFNLTRSISGKLRWENVLWGTAFRDAIVADQFQFNGQDSVVYDGVLSRVIANQNKRNARLWGFSSSLEADLAPDVAVYASVAYTQGRVVEDNGTSPLDHIPPVYGRIGARYHTTKANLEVYALFNGKKPIDQYLLNGEDNEQYAPKEGMPAWVTLNLRAGYHFCNYAQLQAGLENILDVQYRNFASGINGPGRNLYVRLNVKF